MPRKARIDAPGALHHIIVRGINRKKIFFDDADRDALLDRLGGKKHRGQEKHRGQAYTFDKLMLV